MGYFIGNVNYYQTQKLYHEENFMTRGLQFPEFNKFLFNPYVNIHFHVFDYFHQNNVLFLV
jgi:hypothetical protein